MKPAVVRPIVVLSLVAAAWTQAPAANAAKGGHHATASPSTKGGVHLTADGHTEVFSETDTDLATGGVEKFEYVQEFDQRGLLVHTTRSTTVDGTVVQRSEEALTYGTAHRLSKVVTVEDSDGDGPAPASVRVDTLNRNSRHLLVSVTSTIDEDGDGIVDSTATESRTFDKRGRKVSTRIEDDGVVTVESYVYDSHGNILSDTIDTDDLSTPQSPDSRTVETGSYEAHDVATASGFWSYAFDAQSVPVLQQESHTSYTRTTQNGPVTGIVQTFDNNGDGHVDETATSSASYDKQGNPLESTFVDDNGTDVYEASQVYTDNAKGWPVTMVAEESLNGVLLDRLVSDYTYDGFGRPTTTVDTWDRDGDGQTDQIETRTSTYDHRDRLVAATDRVTDGAGVLEATTDTTIEYGTNTSTETQEIDSDGDGVVDRRIVTVMPL